MLIRFYIGSYHSEFSKFILCSLLYCAGALALAFLTLGQINLAPLSTIKERNAGKKWWNDRTIWLHHPEGFRLLRDEVICAVGLLIWIAAVYAFFCYKRTIN